MFVLLIPGKFRGKGCHLFLPQFTNSLFTKHDSTVQQYTAPFTTSELKYRLHNTILYIRVLWSATVNDKWVEKSVLVRSQQQLSPDRKELYSFSPLFPRRVLQRSLRGFVDSKSRFRVQLDIL